MTATGCKSSPATFVPVGQDQRQHVEIARDMARYFNRAFDDEVFVLPEVQLNEAPVVPGVDGQKMSKSYNNTIPLFAEGKPLEKRVMSIKSDSTPLEDPKMHYASVSSLRQHFLYFLPLPQGQGLLRPVLMAEADHECCSCSIDRPMFA